MGENSPGHSLVKKICDTTVAPQSLDVALVSFHGSASKLSKEPGLAFVDNFYEPAVSVRPGVMDVEQQQK